jgi:crotonobetainyl-CoA:carnitine CoA-transferase CaiB-like acyl-CoA transferase
MFQCAIAAVLARETSGQGQFIEVSLLAVQLAMGSVIFSALDNPPDHGFQTADEPIYFGAPTPKSEVWADLCHAIGADELADDPRFNTRAARTPRTPELKPLLERHFRRFKRDELIPLVNQHGGIAVPIHDHETLFHDEQVLANGMKVETILDDGGMISTFGIPWDFAKTPGKIRMSPPRLGQHTEEVRGELGLPGHNAA